MFTNREEAGQRLAEKLKQYGLSSGVVLAIPRGGVVVGYEIAKELGLELDIIIPRKIRAPGNPELAIGALVSEDGVFINEALRKTLHVPEEYLKKEIKDQLDEVKRRRASYMGQISPVNITNKTVIIVDDGLATGYTALAAIEGARQSKPERIVLAVPVAPPDTIEFLSGKTDEIVCLESPRNFYAVGQFYADFTQTGDDEVRSLLAKSAPNR